jgi:hypothetical protein
MKATKQENHCWRGNNVLTAIDCFQRQEELRSGFPNLRGEHEHGLRVRSRSEVLLTLDGS